VGYVTRVDGAFSIAPGLTPAEARYLRKFAKTCRMKRDPERARAMPDRVRERVGLPVGDEGAYFVGGVGMLGQGDDRSIVDRAAPPGGQPDRWCCWEPKSSTSLGPVADECSNASHEEWLGYLLSHFLGPWGQTVSGAVVVTGEFGERRRIAVENGAVTTTGLDPDESDDELWSE